MILRSVFPNCLVFATQLLITHYALRIPPSSFQLIISPSQLITSPFQLITPIIIIADCDFDKEHPAGTSLNDIFTLKYLALYSFIKDGYKTLKEGSIVNFKLIETSKGLQAIEVQEATLTAV